MRSVEQVLKKVSRIRKKTDAIPIASSSDYTAFSTIDISQLFIAFRTGIRGISEKEAASRIEEFGYNEPARKEKRRILKLAARKMLNPLILILLCIVIFSFFFGEKISAAIIGMMCLVSIILDLAQEYQSGKEVEKLNAMVRNRANVIRNGKEREIDIKNLVPGDAVSLHAGDLIPADMRVFSSKDLFVNQSAMTGESFPIEKTGIQAREPLPRSYTELPNIVFMGSTVVSGTGTAIALRTGSRTQFGEMSKKAASYNAATSFEKGINSFVFLMIRLMAILVISIFLIIFFVKHGSLKEALLFSLAVAVGLTPEMLPMYVTLNLSKGAAAMAGKKVIVKKLSAIQNLGAVDVLCTDKTGTLTMDKVVLVRHCDIYGDDDGDVLKYAFIISKYQTGLKNLLDRAILKEKDVLVKEYEKIDEIPYDFERKMMSVAVQTNGSRMLLSKGAPEEIFKRCSRYNYRGKTEKLTDELVERLKEKYYELGNSGFRVLAVAYKETEKGMIAFSKEDESDLILKGYLAFLDPPKPNVRKSLKALSELGIEVKILTGDNERITYKICSEVGLEARKIIHGYELDMMGKKEIGKAAEDANVFVRMSPLQKERIIRALQENGHVVGFLGDGVNDSPSLRTSDVGISVNNGADIAKESADIVLLEKSLTILEEGVKEGRRVFGNILKYIKMGASSNFGNMLSVTGAVIFIPFIPMLPIQIILNNFMYDLGQITLPADDVDKEYLEKPRRWNISFIEKYMILMGPLSTIFDFATFALMWYLFGARMQTPASIALFHTAWFLESLFTQTLVVYVIRTNRMPFASVPKLTLILTSFIILSYATFIPMSPAAHFFGFVTPPALFFAWLSGIVIAYMALVQTVKTWLVRRYGYQ